MPVGLEMNGINRIAANGLNCCRFAHVQRLHLIAAGAVLLLVATQAMPKTKGEPLGTSDQALDVRVTIEGRPVAGAEVAVSDVEYCVRALTDRDGHAKLRVAPDGKITAIVALDVRLGLGGTSFVLRTSPTRAGTVLELPLAPAEPHTIHVVDDNGNSSAPGVDFGLGRRHGRPMVSACRIRGRASACRFSRRGARGVDSARR